MKEVNKLIDQLKPILDAISDYSITIVLVGLFILFIYQGSVQKKARDEADQKRQEQQDAYLKELNKAQSEYLQSLLDRSIQTLKTTIAENKEDHIKEEPNNYYYNKNVVDIMTDTLEKSKASHIFFFSYHNGGKDYEGHSYQRMSCINEVTNGQVMPLQDKYNNMFRTSIYYIYKELNDNGFYNIFDIETIKDVDPGTYHMLLQDNIKANLGCAVMNKNGDAIGFIALAFTESQANEKDLISIVKRCKYKIEGVYTTF